jgi:hypothetical protein
METIRDMLWPKKEIYVGDFAIGVDRSTKIDIFKLACTVLLRYVRTGKVECDTDSLSKFLIEVLKTDCSAKWDWFMRKRKCNDYALPMSILSVPIAPLLSYATRMRQVTVRVAGNELGFSVPLLRPSIPRKGLFLRLAAGLALAPVCVLAAYATLPREKLSTFRLKKAAREHMEDDMEAVECLVVVPSKEIKGLDGEDIVTGSRITKRYTKLNRPKRTPYAAKIAQVARSKVGYLKNSPENRLIYQRVMIEIMDKDHVRYHDRDFILPLAIGCCFVYPDGVEESSALWGSTESLGVK